MADPLDYVLVRIDDDIRDKAVLTYDAVNDKITDSGLIGQNGELQAAAGTVSVGAQNIESVGDEVAFLNKFNSQAYAFPWYYLSEGQQNGTYTREFGTVQTVTRFATRTDVLENPSFTVNVPLDEAVFKLHMNFPEAHTNVEFRVTNAGYEIWRMIKDVGAGDQDILLPAPIAFSAGSYVFSIKAFDDPIQDPVKVMGDAQTGKVGYDVTFRPFTEKPLATQEYVVATITGGPADDVMLKKNYDTDKDGIVDLADNLEGATTAGNDKYYGTDAHGSVGFHALPAGIDEAALTSKIDANTKQAADNKASIATNTAEIGKHETAIEGHGTQLATHASSIDKNTKDLAQLRGEVNANGSELGTLRKNAVDQITATLDDTHKIITVALLSKGAHVDSVAIDLGHWFSDTPQPPSQDHKLYYGFSVNPPLDEATVLRIGTAKTVPSVAGLDIVLTRVSSAPNYMWVWLPDSAGTIKGFTFNGFLSVWQSTALTVAGVPGKFYTSPNQTAATNVSFEVTV